MDFNYNRENKLMKRRLAENAVWYSGIEDRLKRFYTHEVQTFVTFDNHSPETLNYFWSQPTAGQRVRQIHSGIPQLISEKMVDLLVGNGFYIKVLDKNGNEDKNASKRLNDILDYNLFEFKIQEGIELESAFGGYAYKVSISPDFKYPILEVVQQKHYEAKVKAGRIVEDVFITYYEQDGIDYRLLEIYGVNSEGAYIKYKLQKSNSSKKIDKSDYVDVDIKSVDETKDLKDILFPGVKVKLSLYKANKYPNSEFIGSVYGESDYAGSYGAFDAVDEILSTWIQEFRDGKISKFWPENLLPKTETGKITLPPSLQKDFIVYAPGISQESQKQSPFILQADLNVEKHTQSLAKWLTLIINNAGLSPLTLGITGLESIAANELSQNSREKTSIRTRNKKIRLHKSSMESLFEILMVADDIKNNREVSEYSYEVQFEDYDLKTTLDKTTEAGIGLANGSWSIKTAVDYIHTELSEKERTLEVIRIKLEKGINVFTRDEELIYKEFIESVSENKQVKEDATSEVDTTVEKNEEQTEEETEVLNE